MKRLYLDANIYLDFYDLINRATNKLLPALSALAPNVFVTQQIVYEVDRNKVSRAKKTCGQLREKLHSDIGIPAFLDSTIAKLPKSHRELGRPTKPVLAKIETALSAQIKSIAESGDEVSIALKPVFDAAVPASETELIRARLRKEVGNPPGKRSDPLGDQLTWEQLLAHVAAADELWIVTRDTDYYIKDRRECLLHPVLLNDLVGRGLRRNRIHVFDSLAQALQDFNARGGVRVKKLPSKAVLKSAVIEELSQSKFSPEVHQRLEQSIQLLPPVLRIVFVLSDIEGYKPAEIASMMGTPVKEVEINLKTARLSLRELLNRYYKGPK